MKDDRRSRRTRRLVTTAMTELLIERPYDQITVQTILDRADIGRATFYHHFRDKLDVVNAVASEMLESMGEGHAPAATPGKLPLLELFRHAEERQRSLRAMLDTPGGEVFTRESHGVLAAAVERSLPAPGNRPRQSVPAPVVAQFVAGAFLAVLRWWLQAGMPYAPEEMASMFESLLPPLTA